MPSLEQIHAAGPWPVLVFVLILGIVGVWMAFTRKVVVPGWIYDKLEKDYQILRDQTDRNSKALEALVADEEHEQRRSGRGK